MVYSCFITFFFRNITIDILTKHIASLKTILDAGNVSWINEFLSRRHDGLNALEMVFEKLITKKAKSVLKMTNK